MKTRKKIFGALLLLIMISISGMVTFAAEAPRKATMSEQIRAAHRMAAQYQETPAEKKIYSYVQVPPEYCVNGNWSGDWVRQVYGGQEFFHFGCGVCCLSNMFSTITKRAVAPDMMLEWAREYSSYNPDCGRGAISWSQLRKVCEALELPAVVKQKPAAYEDFRADVQAARTTMVLVCKENDDKLWFYTRGHYVNLWEYDPATDTVFVTDASGLFNRSRVPLRDVYNALKTKSDAQYMCVNDVNAG